MARRLPRADHSGAGADDHPGARLLRRSLAPSHPLYRVRASLHGVAAAMSSHVRRRRGQSLVEFALSIGALMVLVVGVAQIAIYLHYRNSLALACREGAFQAGLAGHSLADGEQATADLWQKLEPQASAV